MPHVRVSESNEQVDCEKRNEHDLGDQEEPAVEAPLETWQQYAAEVEQVIEAQGILSRYKQLQVEAKTLAKEAQERWPPDQEDARVIPSAGPDQATHAQICVLVAALVREKLPGRAPPGGKEAAC